ncbi:MAG: valine--tRNA ligase [Thermaerobacter sp.]|nr:valine--tRNA ligase [Bacillota bacterium]
MATEPSAPAGAGAQLAPRYDPREVEQRWYSRWLEQDLFRAPAVPARPVFSIVIPPPNVTGVLHIGHALDNTIQDVLVRRRRMQGYDVLWLPGTDHAGIATQVVVERRLAEEGKDRRDLGRERFLEVVWSWKNEYEQRILGQLQRLGCSCDWSRTRFTMDPGCSRAVREVFVHLYRRGLIYRGHYMINWCPRCRTTLSDLEVTHREVDGKFYRVRYPLADGGTVTVATTRPETILGDTALAVHPGDERYRHLVGREAVVPVLGRRIPIVADEAVDPEFGTGVVKVTPFHDPTDFEIGRRHGLPAIQVIGEDASMTAEAGPFAGLDRWECRRRLVEALAEQGLLESVEDMRHAVGHCQRCDTVVEPLISEQWFVKTKPLAEPAAEAVRTGRTRIVPERFEKIYFHWLDNIRDWPISRQIWWGHRIPAWYCPEGHVTVAVEDPQQCEHCGSRDLEQDPDVLDTWFSSALWPFSTMGWPERTPELEAYYPTSVLVTGYDILFFWVARMMMMGLEFMGDVPFRTVLLHGLVRDGQGQKMSKSRGNTVDPLDVVDRYGADALRWALVTGITPGNDVRLYDEKLEGARNFANKLWNAARFVLANLEGYDPEASAGARRLEDRWILDLARRTVLETDRHYEQFELGEAARAVYEFFWGAYCDWYIELAKPRLGAGGEDRAAAQRTLVEVLSVILRLLHPVMPFITEEIWQRLPGSRGSIVTAPWPEAPAGWADPESARRMEQVIDMVRAVRAIRSEFKIEPGRPVPVWVRADREEAAREAAALAEAALRRLAGAGQVTVLPAGGPRPRRAAGDIIGPVEVYVPLEGVIDLEAEVARLERELAEASSRAQGLARRLENQEFLAKAPPEVVARERQKYADLQDAIGRLEARLRDLTA